MADILTISTPAVFIMTPSSRFNRALICAYLSAQTASWAENCASRFISISSFRSCFDFVWAFQVAITHQVVQYLYRPLHSPITLNLLTMHSLMRCQRQVALLTRSAVDGLPRHRDCQRIAGFQEPQDGSRCWLHWLSVLAPRPAL